ncbi:MAG TPA: glycosyl hydrolase family 28 protein [Steroidobacter sp.]|uniref:glycoside hydrolase family 28 protein n=1 Tax=Steroidobacter sp. TaxID=1978227 RepID=UPI002ED7EBB8
MSIQRRSLLQALAATPVALPALTGASASLASRSSAAASIAPKQANTHQVKDFGAKGDGKTLDTKAIQAAIDAAAQTKGTVLFDGGAYRTGALFLKAGMTFKVDQGVRLLGSQNIDDYPMLPTRIAGIEMTWPAALINVYKERDVKLTGDGIIDGDGKVFWDSYWAKRREYDPKGIRWAADYDCRRPRLIQLFEADNVRIENLSMYRSGFWTVHICYSQNIEVYNVIIRNNEGGRGPSTDGIDIDSSRKVLVEKADITCNDDALCMKAGRDADGLRVARPTEDIVIRDCVVRDAAAGVTFGSETSGGFRNIKVSNIKVYHPTPVGILFKSAQTRGGNISGIEISDIFTQDVPTVMRVNLNWYPAYSYAKIPDGIKEYPDYWKTLSTPVPKQKGIPQLSDVYIHDVKAVGGKTAFEISAYPEKPLKNFRFERLHLDTWAAGSIANADNFTFNDVTILSLDGKTVDVKQSTNIRGL